MNFTDRVTRGFAAGIAGGIVQDIFDLLSYFLEIDEFNNFQWAGIAVYGSKPGNLLEYLVAVFAQLFITGILGVIFAYLIPNVTSKNLIFKGGLFGLASWLVFFIVPLLFKINPLMETRADSAASDAVTGCIYGIVLSLSLNWLSKRQKAQKYES